MSFDLIHSRNDGGVSEEGAQSLDTEVRHAYTARFSCEGCESTDRIVVRDSAFTGG